MNRVTVLIFSVCFIMDMEVQLEILSTFVTVLLLRKTEVYDRVYIGSFESLVSYEFSNLLTVSSNLSFKSSYFLSNWDYVEKMATVQFV